MHLAVSGKNNGECINMLLQADCSVKILNKSLETPFYIINRGSEQPKEVVEALKIKDDGFTEAVIKLKMIGNRFGVKQKPFEGSYQKITLPSIIESVEKFLLSKPQEEDLFNQALIILKEHAKI